jgi:hypothetical protein
MQRPETITTDGSVRTFPPAHRRSDRRVPQNRPTLEAPGPRSGAHHDIKARADLGALERSWEGFRLIPGILWTPENHQLTPGDLRAIPYRRQQLKDLQNALREPKQFTLL